MAVPFAYPAGANAAICNRSNRGRFVGRLRFDRFYPDLFQLVQPYAFIDSCGKNWSAPVEALTDGASIPRVAQMFIGDPYSGPYLNAAVIHDWFCAVRTEPYPEVHRMFYNAMIASSVGDTLAQIMYTAVCWKGPKWDSLTVQNNRLRLRQDPASFIKSLPPPAPPPPLPAAPEMPPEPPDLSLVSESRLAFAAGYTEQAEALLSRFESQSVAYNDYLKREEVQKSSAQEMARQYRAAEASKEDERRREVAQFQALLAATLQGDKSLNEVATIAGNFPT